METVLSPEMIDRMAPAIVQLRSRFRDEFGRELESFVEFIEKDRFLEHASLATNILYGVPTDPAWQPGNLAHNYRFMKFFRCCRSACSLKSEAGARGSRGDSARN